MKYIKVFTATSAYELQCGVREYEQNTKHTPVNQSCSVAYDSDSRIPERYILTVTYNDGSSE